MLNQVILVGRLVRTPELHLTESGRKRSSITLAVSRGYKNQDGEYETDFLDCILWTGVAESTSEYCKSGDIIGVKGRLQTRLLDNEDGTKHKKVEVVADKVTFLSSARSDKMQRGNDNEIIVEEINDSNDDGIAQEIPLNQESSDMNTKANKKKR